MQRSGSSGSSRPTSREKHVSGGSSSVSRRGSGLNLGGPVGNSGGYQGRPGLDQYGRGGGGGFSLVGFLIVMAAIVVLIVYLGFDGDWDRFFESSGEIVRNVVSGFQKGSDSDAESSKKSSKSSKSSSKDGEEDEEGESLELVKNIAKGGAAIAAAGAAGVAAKTLLSGESGIIPSFAEDMAETQVKSLAEGGGGETLIDPSKIVWSKNGDGVDVLKLSDEDWENIEIVKLNVFFDDGEGFIDLGLDAFFEFDDDLNLIGQYDGTWLALDGHTVAYYHLATHDHASDPVMYDEGDYRMVGYVPAFVNEERANIILVFDSDTPEGYVEGAKAIEEGTGADLSEKEMTSDLFDLKKEDQIDFICDYYDYQGNFLNNYYLGESMELEHKMSRIEVSNVLLEDAVVSAAYRITDNNGNHYWTPEIEQFVDPE